MRIGKLRHRLVIEAENPTTDSGGGQTDPWADPTEVAKVWAGIEPLSGTEQLRGMQLTASVTHRITVRYRTGLTAKHRLRKAGTTRVFNIRSVTNLEEERDRFLVLLVEEGVAI